MPKPNQIEGWEKDFESLWGASFDREGDIEPFEFERLKDFVRQLLETAKKEERDMRPEAILDRRMIEKIRKEAIHSILTSVMEEMGKEKVIYCPSHENYKPKICDVCNIAIGVREKYIAIIQKYLTNK